MFTCAMGMGSWCKQYTKSIVNSTDPFGDGSLVYKLQLNNDTLNLLGTDDDNTWDGTEAYDIGKFDYAAKFDGSTALLTEYVLKNDDTISMFVYLDSSNDGNDIRIWNSERGTTDDSTVTGINITSDGYIEFYYDGNDVIKQDFGGLWDQWVHIVCIIGEKRLFVNAVEFTDLIDASGRGAGDDKLTLGALIGGSTKQQYIVGLIDQVEIYNRALNPQEVEMLYLQKKYIDDPTKNIPGLVAHYPLDGTADDLTGNYSGTENGGLAYEETDLGIASKFDGDDDYITTPDIILQDFTVIGWVYLIDADNYTNEITTNNDSGTDLQELVIRSDDTVRIDLDTDGYGVNWDIDVSTEFNNRWRFVTFKREVDSTSFHLDGIQVGDTQTTVTTDFTIKALMRSSAFYGNLKNVRIYDRALTEDEIKTIYDYEKLTRNPAIDRGLVAYYPLSTNTYDHWINQYDGTINGDVTFDGLSASFDGDGDYITLNNELKSFTNSDYSYSFWIKKNGNDDDAHTPLNVRNNNSGTQDGTKTACFINVYDNSIKLLTIGTDDDDWVTAETNYTLNDTFIHITVSTIGNDHFVYINGELNPDLKTTTSGNVTVTDDNQLLVGVHHYGDTYANYFDGEISNIHFYDRALTQEEITTIYESEKGEFE